MKHPVAKRFFPRVMIASKPQHVSMLFDRYRVGIFSGGKMGMKFSSCSSLPHIGLKKFDNQNKLQNRKCMSTKANSTARTKQVIVVRHGETDWNRQLKVQGSTDIPLNDKGISQAKATAQALLENFIHDSMLYPSPNGSTNIRIFSSPLIRALDTARAIENAVIAQNQNQFSGGSANATTSNMKTTLLTSCKLKEWNLGVLEGLTKDEAASQHTVDWKIFQKWADPYRVSPSEATVQLSNGESMEQVRRRVINFIEKSLFSAELASGINCASNGPVNDILVCVTHGGVMGQLLRHVVRAQEGSKGVDFDGEEGRSQSHLFNKGITYHRPDNACISKFKITMEEHSISTTKRKHNGSLSSEGCSLSVHRRYRWKIVSWAETLHLQGDLAPVGSNYDKRPHELKTSN